MHVVPPFFDRLNRGVKGVDAGVHSRSVDASMSEADTVQSRKMRWSDVSPCYHEGRLTEEHIQYDVARSPTSSVAD
jgi:hypothetical protein